MNIFYPPLHFRYMARLYIKNLFAILFGLSFSFAIIDYFQHVEELSVTVNYKVLYVFYMWQEALGLLYPLALVFAAIMTKMSLVKNNTMGVLHAFGYSKRRLLFPLFIVASIVYAIFTYLHTTEFSYAKDKAAVLLENQINAYDVNDLFFKYNDTFVYVNKLDPIEKKIEDITIFKVEGYRVLYTINAPVATFDGFEWDAQDVPSTNILLDSWFSQATDTEEYYILVPAFSGVGSSIYKRFEDSFKLIQWRVSNLPVTITFIEPQMKSANIFIKFFKKAIDKIGVLLLGIEESTETNDRFNWYDPIRNNVARSGVSVVSYYRR